MSDCTAKVTVHYAARRWVLECDGEHSADGRHHNWWSALAGTEILWPNDGDEVDALTDKVWEYR